MRYRQDYVDDGFASDPAPTDAQIFGEVVDLAKADDLDADASPNVYPGIGFGSTERSGGFIKPDQEIALLSRRRAPRASSLPPPVRRASSILRSSSATHSPDCSGCSTSPTCSVLSGSTRCRRSSPRRSERSNRFSPTCVP
ncbi:MAG: hypothetical protein WKF58_14995 [Ilumatobacteraceae bacterium]